MSRLVDPVTGVKINYTYGVRAGSSGELLFFGMEKAEAERVAACYPGLQAIPVSTRKYCPKYYKGKKVEACL